MLSAEGDDDKPRRRVLIVEDNEDLAILERVALADVADVELLTHDFGRALLPETWEGIDAAVIDLMLPDVDGETIVRYLHDTIPRVRRVICTAKPLSLLVEIEPYADVLLLKPFTPAALVAAVAA